MAARISEECEAVTQTQTHRDMAGGGKGERDTCTAALPFRHSFHDIYICAKAEWADDLDHCIGTSAPGVTLYATLVV
jgi:hypothetical protein